MLQYLVFLGAAISLFGGSFYVRDTLRGNTKPNRVTWLMWAAAPMIGTAAALADGVGWATLPVFMAGFIPLLVLIASFVNPNAYWKLEKFDYLCGFFSILALVLWGITKEPLVAIIFAMIGDGFAAMPTLIKSWKHPETETGLVYIGAIGNQLTSFFAIKMWSVSEYAFPLYLLTINTLLVLAIYRRKFIK